MEPELVEGRERERVRRALQRALRTELVEARFADRRHCMEAVERAPQEEKDKDLSGGRGLLGHRPPSPSGQERAECDQRTAFEDVPPRNHRRWISGAPSSMP